MALKDKEKRKEYLKAYYIANSERIKEQTKKYKQQHKDYYKDYNKNYFQLHKDELVSYNKEWANNNRDKHKEYIRKYHQTKKGRAHRLRSDYCVLDKKKNVGKSTLTAEWILENIFTSKCVYCGETDWKKLGCDRIDNSKPHTPDNCVPCCRLCNTRRGRMRYEIFKALSTPQFLTLKENID